MLRIYFLLIFVLSFCSSSRATNLPTLQLSISRDSQNLPLEWNDWVNKNAEIYVDSTGEQSFLSIENQPFSALPNYPKPKMNAFGIVHFRYWLRFKVRNQHPTDSLHIVFRCVHHFVHFFSRQHPPPTGLCADIGVYKQSALPSIMRCDYPLSIAPKDDSMVVYVRFGNRSEPDFVWSVALATQARMLQDNQFYFSYYMPKISFTSVLHGALFLMLCIGFLFFWFNRQAVFAYYAAYITGLLLTFLRAFENDFGHEFPILFSYFPISLIWSEGIFVGLLQIFYAQFLIHLLNLQTSHLHCYRILRVTILVSWVYIGVDLLLEIFFFKQHLSINPYVVYRLVMAVVSLYIVWLLGRMTGRVAQFVFWGTLSLLLGILLSIPFMLNMSLVPRFDHLFLMKIGIFIEMLFFSAALAFKNQQMEAEHRQKLEENNVLLTQLSEQSELKRKTAEAELKHTRAQMRTHLLFNVVNSAKNAVLSKKPLEAAEQLADLAAFMRLSLAHSRQSSVSLGEELQLLKKYIDLEKRRLSNAFQLDWQVENTLPTYRDRLSVFSPKIPTLLLQPFVENAIIHGLLPKKEENNRLLTIKVHKEADTVICIIEDNGVGCPKATMPNDSLGLTLTKERILLFNELNTTNITWTIEDVVNTEGGVCGTLVRIIIPLISNND